MVNVHVPQKQTVQERSRVVTVGVHILQGGFRTEGGVWCRKGATFGPGLLRESKNDLLSSLHTHSMSSITRCRHMRTLASCLAISVDLASAWLRRVVAEAVCCLNSFSRRA